jgi:hypothetical protein
MFLCGYYRFISKPANVLAWYVNTRADALYGVSVLIKKRTGIYARALFILQYDRFNFEWRYRDLGKVFEFF